MGAKFSTSATSPRIHASNGARTDSTSDTGGLSVLSQSLRHRSDIGDTNVSNSGSESRQRARSLSNVLNGHSDQSITASSNNSTFGDAGSLESDRSIPDDIPFNRVFAAHSLPVQWVSFHGIKCPVCSKFVPPDDVECHLVICLTKPRISYNEDVLREDKGECVICLEELNQGDTIARLPCLCIYHKLCIDAWFKINRSCPEHPLD